MEATKRKSSDQAAKDLGKAIATGQSATDIDPELKVTPTVTSVRPNFGPIHGGTLVTIKGTNFRPRSRVLFGITQPLVVFYVDAQTLRCITPPGRPGFVDVSVINPSGTRGVLPNGFLYLPYGQVAENLVEPAELSAAEADLGQSDQGTAEVESAEAGTEMSAAGEEEGIVVLPGGPEVDQLGDIDLQTPPVVTSVTPNKVDTNGGKMVTIKGSNFRAGSTVTFGMLPASNVVFVNRETLTCIVPQHPAGNVKVRVTNQKSGLTGTLSMGFTYTQAPAPVISGLFPNPVPRSTFDTGVTVFGANFANGCMIIYGAAMGPAIFVNSSQVGFSAPAQPPGTTIGVGIRNPDGQIVCCAILLYN
ncbi:MAG: large repetitive protein [Chloroflexia bacterium]|jgi:hypothetical protein|nr:large repetitive protein [Chloroflexia bacterium]